jgi:DNA gyrase/topoisomerase IV subunit A
MTLVSSEKIDEWMKEVEQRPESAATILRFVANRLRDLTARNEALLEENIALMNGKKVEQYEARIAHLEYQLEVLKRQFGDDLNAAGVFAAERSKAELLNLLVYTAQGRVLRLELGAGQTMQGLLGRLPAPLTANEEPPRLLAIVPTEELMAIFTSGRVATLSTTAIPLSTVPRDAAGKEPTLDWVQAVLPCEPRAGERLACLMPVSKMMLAEYFVQVSRRGLVKKIRSTMAQSILANSYIGAGVKQAPDRLLTTLLTGKDDRLGLVSREGFLWLLEVKGLSFSAEETVKLGVSDHLVSAFVYTSDLPVAVMTQIGKVVQLAKDNLEVQSGVKPRGQAVYSTARREKGVRVVGAGAVQEGDQAVALHQDGRLTLHAMRDLLGAGVVPTQSELVAFVTFTMPGGSQ